MKRKLHSPLTAHLGEGRTLNLRAGTGIEEYYEHENGMVRVTWPSCTEASGSALVHREELEAATNPA